VEQVDGLAWISWTESRGTGGQIEWNKQRYSQTTHNNGEMA
jgi:hypothetical protein